jgi:hypothetical protein
MPVRRRKVIVPPESTHPTPPVPREPPKPHARWERPFCTAVEGCKRGPGHKGEHLIHREPKAVGKKK